MSQQEDRRVQDLQNALLDLVKRINALERRVNELEAAEARRRGVATDERGERK